MRPEGPLQRLALCIEYDGSSYSGWQAQRDPHRHTVQESLEQALSRIADSPVQTVCAGRTDAGVHACGQVVHFDTSVSRPARAWTLGTNSLLPPGIAVQWAAPVAADFHARFSATARTYRYLILNRPERSPLRALRAARERRPLDAGHMDEAARALLGEQDFSAFRGAGCQSRTAMRCVQAVRVRRAGELVCMDIRANAFLLHMVRNIAGSLIRVGAGEAGIDWIAELMASRDRRLAASTAPPQGLYLSTVTYGLRWGLPPGPPPPLAEAIPPLE